LNKGNKLMSNKFTEGVSGNPNGRPTGTKQNARKIGATKLKKLLRALEPLADSSILVAAEIMNDTEASQATRLKAAMTLLQKYTELTGEVYFEQLPKEEEKEAKDSDSESVEEEEESSQGGKLAFLAKK
jgi:hypothetical protein